MASRLRIIDPSPEGSLHNMLLTILATYTRSRCLRAHALMALQAEPSRSATDWTCRVGLEPTTNGLTATRILSR
jgi:hypothetical protein